MIQYYFTVSDWLLPVNKLWDAMKWSNYKIGAWSRLQEDPLQHKDSSIKESNIKNILLES